MKNVIEKFINLFKSSEEEKEEETIQHKPKEIRIGKKPKTTPKSNKKRKKK